MKSRLESYFSNEKAKKYVTKHVSIVLEITGSESEEVTKTFLLTLASWIHIMKEEGLETSTPILTITGGK